MASEQEQYHQAIQEILDGVAAQQAADVAVGIDAAVQQKLLGAVMTHYGAFSVALDAVVKHHREVATAIDAARAKAEQAQGRFRSAFPVVSEGTPLHHIAGGLTELTRYAVETGLQADDIKHTLGQAVLDLSRFEDQFALLGGMLRELAPRSDQSIAQGLELREQLQIQRGNT